jgi:hypothetical protein
MFQNLQTEVQILTKMKHIVPNVKCIYEQRNKGKGKGKKVNNATWECR